MLKDIRYSTKKGWKLKTECISFPLVNSFHGISVCLASHCSTNVAALEDIKRNQRCLTNLTLLLGMLSFHGLLSIGPAMHHVPCAAFNLEATMKP